MHHKRRRPKNRRAGCLMCKYWKINGFGKGKESETYSSHRRRRQAEREIRDWYRQ